LKQKPHLNYKIQFGHNIKIMCQIDSIQKLEESKSGMRLEKELSTTNTQGIEYLISWR